MSDVILGTSKGSHSGRGVESQQGSPGSEQGKEMSYRYKQQQVGSAERKVQGGDGLGW